MNWKNILFVSALGAGAYFALNYFAGGIRYAFKGIKMRGLDGLKLKVSLLYTLQNVNDISATVSGLDGRILYGNYELNQLSLLQPVTIAPGATEEMDVQFTISPGALLAEILQFFEKKDGFKKFTLKGVMRGKIGQVPFVYPLNESLQLAE